jgi:transposase-like protein
MSKRKTYSQEYKIGAIQIIEQKGMTKREASEALRINEGMLGS